MVNFYSLLRENRLQYYFEFSLFRKTGFRTRYIVGFPSEPENDFTTRYIDSTSAICFDSRLTTDFKLLMPRVSYILIKEITISWGFKREIECQGQRMYRGFERAIFLANIFTDLYGRIYFQLRMDLLGYVWKIDEKETWI